MRSEVGRALGFVGRVARFSLVLTLGWVAVPLSPATAQNVVGRIVEAGNGRGVGGALVRLEAPDGRLGALVLTAEDGRYRVSSLAAGTVYLVVERIGFERSRLGPIEVPATGSVAFDVTLSIEAVTLTGLDVGGDTRRCALVPEAAVSTQRYWDEARKALEAAVWTEQQRSLEFQIRSREAILEPGSLAVRDQELSEWRVFGGNTVRSLPADDLARGGYVRAAPDGSFDFYAPDAAALLSPDFLATHCMEAADGEGESGDLVGLRFRPIPGRDTTDVQGTVWIERTSGRLDRVEFAYTGLPAWPGRRHAGGTIHFAELPDGRWIVGDWYIRAPMTGVVRTAGIRGTTDRLMTIGVTERGSEVLAATGPGVDWAPNRPTGSLDGLVFDSLAGAPALGAEVRLAGRSRRVRTGPDGTFRIDGVPPGRYRVEFGHARLDSLGLEPGWQEVDIVGGAVATVRLALPSPETLLALGCRTDPGAAVVGWVTAATTGLPVPGALVVTLDAATEDGQPLRTTTGADGSYRLCGARVDRPLTVVARLGPLTSSSQTATPRRGVHARADLSLTFTGGEVAEGGSSREEEGPALLGTVIDVASGRPVADALVELLDSRGRVVRQALADLEGRFLLRPETPGPHTVHARVIGYADLTGGPLELVRGTKQVEIRLAPEAIAVEGLVVTVEARAIQLERNGFYERRLQTGGKFLTREAIEAMVPLRTTDVLLRVPGIQRVAFPSEDTNTTVRRIQVRGRDQRCLPAVYVDGALARGPVVADGEVAQVPQIDDLVPWHLIEAIEIYETPVSTPVKFLASGPRCGVIVIWTR